MLVVTTDTLEGKRIRRHLGLVSGEAILGANIFRDFFAGIRDIVGGRAAAYEKELRQAKAIALEEMEMEARELKRFPIGCEGHGAGYAGPAPPGVEEGPHAPRV